MEKIPWIYKICKSDELYVRFFSLKFPPLLRLSRSDESDKADIVLNLLSSKQQTTLSLAEKFYFYRRGREGISLPDSLVNEKANLMHQWYALYQKSKRMLTPPSVEIFPPRCNWQSIRWINGPMMYWKEMHTYAKHPFRRNIPAK